MNKEKYRTKRIEEYKIGARTHDKIRDLLRRGFTGYPADRSYFQQIPTFRYLVYQEKQLIGHMAVEHRMINMSEEVYAIFGIVDFCVDPDFQSLRIATHLLSEVEAEARKYGIDFLVLVAKDHGLYEKMGYQLRENICRWLIIHKRKTLGVGHRKISQSLMIKPTGDHIWKDGLVDFLGPIF